RAEYRPVVSTLTASARPLDVAQAFRTHFGFTTLYLADLDAIAGQPPARAAYSELMAHGFSLWIDAGVRDAALAGGLAQAGLAGVVLGLETVSGPGVVGQVCGDLGPERVIFSLDLKGGEPLVGGVWEGNDAESIARQVIGLGIRRLIVLDVARVG